MILCTLKEKHTALTTEFERSAFHFFSIHTNNSGGNLGSMELIDRIWDVNAKMLKAL